MFCFTAIGKPVASGRIRNLSAGGVVIETDYRPGAGKRFVEFARISGNGNDSGEHRVRALIIHHTQQGIGIVIDDIDSLFGLISREPSMPKFQSIPQEDYEYSKRSSVA